MSSLKNSLFVAQEYFFGHSKAYRYEMIECWNSAYQKGKE